MTELKGGRMKKNRERINANENEHKVERIGTEE